MSERSGFSLRRAAPRLALVGFIGSVAAACSSDTMRFAESPFSNPFGSSARTEPQTTAALPPVSAAPAGSVQSQPLAAPAPVASAPLAPPSAQAPRAVAVAPATVPAGPAVPQQKGWTAQGGSTVILAAGETIKTLSNRYGVPESAIRGANGLGTASQPAPGTRIVIPVYHAVDGGAPVAAPAVAAAPGQKAVVAAAPAPAADTAPKHRMQLVKGAQPAGEASTAPVKTAATAVPKEQVKTAKADAVKAEPVKAAEVKSASAKPVKAAPAGKVESQQVAAAEPPPAATPVKSAQPAATPAETAETTGSLAPQAATESGTQFRWPARGRVIAGFGKQGGNDGINISLPEGTPVKAAESGVVAYAGSELKGYGNLVLIRHENGWVSAYAHNSEIKVKRGDTVSRGQVVALSGQSGNVNAPQLHFELRKGSTPVDPMPHLAGL
jgi:murein DD-endopeptidase MepM/ murein hydrolase activator NlpD